LQLKKRYGICWLLSRKVQPMSDWFQVDFAEIFTFQRPPLDTFLRGTLVYLSTCVLLRVIPKRQAGKLSPNDLIVIVFLGGIGTTALELAPMSVPDVLVVMTTILFWSFAIDWLAYRHPRLRSFLQEPPTPLVKDGRLLAGNLRREMITEEEFMAQLRGQGVTEIREIKQACLEVDGTISVVREEGQTPCGNATADIACRAGGDSDRSC
jgi:uncharacterized membrane protein YcaP (DUF421 family)